MVKEVISRGVRGRAEARVIRYLSFFRVVRQRRDLFKRLALTFGRKVRASPRGECVWGWRG